MSSPSPRWDARGGCSEKAVKKGGVGRPVVFVVCRRAGGGIESLRAIPWIFAWSQNRLMLPAWLGAGAALQNALDRGCGEQLRQMASAWPFFATRLSMLEMVFAKHPSIHRRKECRSLFPGSSRQMR